MQKRSSKKPILRLESLENRNLMAGDVAANVLGGTLFLSGDQEANGVVLSSTAEDGQFIVAGIDAGGEATTINGEVSPLVIDDAIRRVVIRTGDGDDVVKVPHMQLTGWMNVRTGRGDDTVKIGDAEADAALVNIRRGLNVNLGIGDDEAAIGNTRARWLRVNGGTGDDSIHVKDARVRRGLRIAGRSGSDDIRLNNVTARNIGISGGADNDTVSVAATRATRLSVQMGFGDDQLSVHDSKFRRTGLRGGVGTDALRTDLALEDIYVRGFENV